MILEIDDDKILRRIHLWWSPRAKLSDFIKPEYTQIEMDTIPREELEANNIVLNRSKWNEEKQKFEIIKHPADVAVDVIGG